MNRKTTILLTGTLTVSMLLGVAATANADDIGAFADETVHTIETVASEKPNATTGTWFTVDGEPIADFAPADGWDDPDTDYTDSAIHTVDGGSVETVSYTHLDVYKRQGLEGADINAVAQLANQLWNRCV